MHYMEVLVADAAYHGEIALTYCHIEAIATGSIVVVPLRSKKVLGIVIKSVKRPAFKTKAIVSLAELPPLPLPSLELLEWMLGYYPGPSGVITQLFLPKKLPKKRVEPAESPEINATDLSPLTSDQAHVLDTVAESGTHLLHGETGTGKTRVYIELAKRSVTRGRSVVILTPEIGLTSQLAHDFRQAFNDKVIVVHSQLTDATRQRLWVSIAKQSGPLIIIGARSALFCPLQDIGLIVVDEAHETAYKQDQMPYYHANLVAGKLSALHKALLVLGSATPLVQDYYLAKKKSRPILRMKKIATNTSTTEISVVDLRDRSKFTKKSYLSDDLLSSVADRLQVGEQSLLFLNRRGTARVVFCEQCGWQATCPHCDTPLIYHGDKHMMCCHSCSYNAISPASCPDCHNNSIIFRSVGTKAIVDEIQRIFPGARVQRFDTDNKKGERIENHYAAIKDGEIDILIGTQTLAKGLDLPKLGLVGVVMADTSLYLPDFSAQERTYQLLSQVIGRVGRGHRAGKVVIQTYAPDSPLLKAILEKNWDYFYNKEIEERQSFLFPPFCYLLKLTCRRATAASAERSAEQLAERLKKSALRIIVEGPAPAFHEKMQNKYQWQLVIKSKNREELTKIVRNLPSGWSYDIDPVNLL